MDAITSVGLSLSSQDPTRTTTGKTKQVQGTIHTRDKSQIQGTVNLMEKKNTAWYIPHSFTPFEVVSKKATKRSANINRSPGTDKKWHDQQYTSCWLVLSADTRPCNTQIYAIRTWIPHPKPQPEECWARVRPPSPRELPLAARTPSRTEGRCCPLGRRCWRMQDSVRRRDVGAGVMEHIVHRKNTAGQC